MAGGGGLRKHGRNKKKPCNMRYTAEERWRTNKERKQRRRKERLDRAKHKRRGRHEALMER